VPRFKLTIEYAGTRYSGWQIQKNARTIQGEIDRAVRVVTGRKDFELYGSGRTDAGVHALAQVAHLDVSTTLPPEALIRGINNELPADINVLGAIVVPHRFHARHDAVARQYVYQIARRRTAFAKPFVWWIKDPLDLDRMRRAAGAFVGMRDFKSFAVPADEIDDADAAGGKRKPSTVVLLERLDLVENGDIVLIVVEGSHFLWRMVRRIVGVLAEVGRGGLDPASAPALLAGTSDLPARLTAPPSGLFLSRVYYKSDQRGEPVSVPTPLGGAAGGRRSSGTPADEKLAPSTSRTTSA
jgi:tRNA pseudouridine38-40 synthase